ncbi:hypothetical protein D3C73_863010 [compost metagenome]
MFVELFDPSFNISQFLFMVITLTTTRVSTQQRVERVNNFVSCDSVVQTLAFGNVFHAVWQVVLDHPRHNVQIASAQFHFCANFWFQSQDMVQEFSCRYVFVTGITTVDATFFAFTHFFCFWLANVVEQRGDGT